MGYKQRTTVKLLGERPKESFVVIPKALILDRELSADARLVGIYLRSLSDGWETNQQQIAQALGWPTKSKRVGNAMGCLIARGWLRHNEYKSGNRTFKHEYVMNRGRRFNAVESTAYEDDGQGGANQSYAVESTPLYTVESTVSPKYQSQQNGFDTDTLQEVSGGELKMPSRPVDDGAESRSSLRSPLSKPQGEHLDSRTLDMQPAAPVIELTRESVEADLYLRGLRDHPPTFSMEPTPGEHR